MSTYQDWRWSLDRYMVGGWVEVGRFPTRTIARNEAKRMKKLPLALPINEHPFRVRDNKTNRIHP